MQGLTDKDVFFIHAVHRQGNFMFISLKDYPQFATAHQLVKEFDGAVIAGGAPRDLLTGKELGDIDIFIPTLSTPHLVEMTLQAAAMATEHGLSIEVAGYEAYGDEIIRLRLGEIIDLCFMAGGYAEADEIQTPTDLFTKFDFVCCQAWLQCTDDGFVAHATELFHELNERKILGFYPHKGSLKSNHAIKVLAKYDDYLLLELARTQEPSRFGSNTIDTGSDIPF